MSVLTFDFHIYEVIIRQQKCVKSPDTLPAVDKTDHVGITDHIVVTDKCDPARRY